MGVLAEPEFIQLPMGLEQAIRLEIRAFDDAVFSDTANVTGESASLWVKLPAGTWQEYAVTWDAEGTGQGHVDLSNSLHDTAGQYEAQLHHQGVLKRRYTLEFVETAS